MKICIYAISKNEEAFVERCLQSCKDADLFVLADTGSTDDTVAVAQGLGATVHSIHVSPWRFDDARNAALALVPKDMDICISVDLDEVMLEGWRREVERLWVPGETTRMRYHFDWGHGVRFVADKFHARSGYRWRFPCHETITADVRMTERVVQSDRLLIQHLPDDSKSRGQYLDLLSLSAKESPHEPRVALYYARELVFYERYEEAIVELERYLTLPGATGRWDRAYAMRLLGDCYTDLGKREDAYEQYERATREAPERRESWHALAYHFYEQLDWPRCYFAAKRTIQTTTHRNDWPVEPSAWGAEPFDLLALSAYQLGHFNEAIRYGADALALDPTDERLKQNLSWYQARGKSPDSLEPAPKEVEPGEQA